MGFNKHFVVHEGKKWERITKRKANQIYEEGKPVHIVSSNIIPFNSWGFGTTLIKKDIDESSGIPVTFNNIVKQYEWYNCTSETGYYASFYTAI